MIRIATLKGSLTDPFFLAVRLFSLMHEGVHTEIWFNGYRIMVGMRAEDRAHPTRDGCIAVLPPGEFSAPASPASCSPAWHVVDVPITNPGLALEFIERAFEARVPYGINVLECALPKALLDDFDPDLDCMRPDRWDRVFCSQFVLLFLRWCDAHGILGGCKEDGSKALLWSVNSRGCLPSRLEIITDTMFAGPGKA